MKTPLRRPFSITQSPNHPITGFTLIELVFVTVVLGVLLVAAMPDVRRAWSRMQRETLAFELAQMLRTARTLAVTQGQPLAWTWDADNKQVSLKPLKDSGPAGSIPKRLSGPRTIPDPIALRVVRLDEPATQIAFFPDGTSQPVTVLVGGDGHPTYRIAVDDATGQVSVQQAGLSPR